jgi:hypothetical protein
MLWSSLGAAGLVYLFQDLFRKVKMKALRGLLSPDTQRIRRSIRKKASSPEPPFVIRHQWLLLKVVSNYNFKPQ